MRLNYTIVACCMLSGRFFGALNPRCHSLSRILMRWSQINVIHIGLVMLSGSRLSKMFHLLTMTMGLGLLSLSTYLPGMYFLILGPYPAFFAKFQNFGHIANYFMETLYICWEFSLPSHFCCPNFSPEHKTEVCHFFEDIFLLLSKHILVSPALCLLIRRGYLLEV